MKSRLAGGGGGGDRTILQSLNNGQFSFCLTERETEEDLKISSPAYLLSSRTVLPTKPFALSAVYRRYQLSADELDFEPCLRRLKNVCGMGDFSPIVTRVPRLTNCMTLGQASASPTVTNWLGFSSWSLTRLCARDNRTKTELLSLRW